MIRSFTLCLIAAAFYPAHAQTLTLTRDEMVALTSRNPFERFPDRRPKIPDSIVERARGMSAEEIFAVLPPKGYRNQ